jgi:hypothetical protein
VVGHCISFNRLSSRVFQNQKALSSLPKKALFERPENRFWLAFSSAARLSNFAGSAAAARLL